jgi:hypothetical protein
MVLKPVSVGLSLVVRVLVTVIGVAVPPGAVGEGVMMEVITWVVGVRVGAVVVWVVAWVVAGVLEGGSDVGEGDEGGGEEAGGRDEGRVTGVDEGGLGVGEVTGEEGSAGEEGDEGRWDGVAVGVGGGPDEVSTEEIGGLALDGLEDGSVEAADGEGATEETTRGDVLAVPLLAMATAERERGKNGQRRGQSGFCWKNTR